MRLFLLLQLFVFSLVWSAKGQISCSDAVPTTVGTHTLPATTADYYWYSFVMPSEGKLEITSSAGEYVYIYSNSCSDPSSEGNGRQNTTITSLKSGNEVFIRWDTKKGGDFEWQLSISPIEVGEYCGSGASAIEGINTVPVVTWDEYWHRYTIPSDGKLIIRSTDRYANIYRNTCGNLDYAVTTYGSEFDYSYVAATNLHSGEEVYIKWSSLNGGGFDWNLLMSPVEVGDNCTVAANAIVGENAVPATTLREYWYHYIMPIDGKLRVNSSANEFVYIYSGTCGNLPSQSGKYQQASVTNLSSGDDVYIRWKTEKGGNFSWDLSVSPTESGDYCAVSITAVEGTNTISATVNDEYWYKYTMPVDGKLKLSTTANGYVYAYGNTCAKPYYKDYGHRDATISDLHSGEDVYIKWRTIEAGDFDWQLNVEPLEQGEHCSSSTTAIEGTNTTSTAKAKHWYRFVMPRDGKLALSTSDNRYVYVYRNSCFDKEWIKSGYQGASTTIVSSGEELFILWSSSNEGSFTWDLSVSPLEAGDNCATAVDATEGTNTVPANATGSYWYRYTMPEDGKLTLSSSYPTDIKYVVVYKGNCQDLAPIISWYEGTTIKDLLKGDEVIIAWHSQSKNGYEWDLSFTSQEAGDRCATAALAHTGINTANDSPSWFEFEAPEAGVYTISSLGRMDTTYLDVYLDCEQPRVNEVRQSEASLSLEAGQRVYIYWYDLVSNSPYYSSSSFDWVILKSSQTKANQVISFDPLPDKTIENATFELTATASSGLSITYTSSNQEVATISGSTVTVVGVGSTTIVARQAGNENYSLAPPVAQNLMVNKATQTIVFEAIPNKSLEDDTLRLVAIASSGLPVIFSSSDETVATVSNDTVTLIGIGTTIITATQEGNEHYIAALPVTQPLTVFSCQDLTLSIVDQGHITCHGAANGTFTVKVSGGHAPYQYSLDGITFQDSAYFTNLDSGEYELIVRDTNECTAIAEVTILSPEALMLSGLVNSSTESSGNGSITLNVSGGQAPYQYTWNNGDVTAILSNLTMGNYEVTVTDATGCKTRASFIVEGVTAVNEQPHQVAAIYPNPSKGELYIDIPNSSMARIATLYSMSGQKVREVKLVVGHNQLQIDGLKRGSYLLKFDDGSSQRIVVDR